MARSLGWCVSIWLVAAGLLASVALADEPGVDDQAPANLVCSARGLPAVSLERAGVSSGYSCRVVGAAPDETSFTLRAQLLGPDGSPGEIVDPFCSGDLDAGTGLCSRRLSVEGGARTPALNVSGTLLPSGRELGATTVVAGFLPRPLPPEMLPPLQD